MKRDHAWNARIVRPRELSAAEIERWTSFCHGEQSLGHPFFSYAFARAVDRARAHVFVAVLEREGRIVGFLPFQFAGRLARVLGAAERIGGTMADRFGVIAGEALGLSSAQLLGLVRLNSLSYSFMPADQLRHGFSGQRVVSGQHVRLSGDEQSFWSALKAKSRKFAANVERNERLLAKEFGPLVATLHAEPATELPRLIQVKGAQYLRTEGVNPLTERWRTDLFRELLAAPDQDCTAVLSTLYAGETWLASHLGIMSPTVFHYWYPVYNPDYARFSPGHVLTKYLVLSALSAGNRYFDMAGYGRYKDHFHPESYDYHAGFWRADGTRGFVNQFVQSVEWRAARAMTSRRRHRIRDVVKSQESVAPTQ